MHTEKLIFRKKIRVGFNDGNMSSNSQKEGSLVFEKDLQLHDGASSCNENLVLGLIRGFSLAADSTSGKSS